MGFFVTCTGVYNTLISITLSMIRKVNQLMMSLELQL